MEALEIVVQLGQKCLQETPVVVLGSGHSAAYGVSGMGALKQHLRGTVSPGPNEQEKTAWAGLISALEEHDLETALQKVTLPHSLLAAVAQGTRNLLLPEDVDVFRRVVSGEIKLALSRLFRHLFNSTNQALSVITTNYDRLAEYAADAARYTWHTGFTGQYLRLLASSMTASNRRPQGRVVEVWKVHGSLDWFVDEQGVVTALPDDSQQREQLTPLLVTPGTAKYETTHQEPFRSIIQNADAALASARSYLCVGYGFNDTHLQPKLVERVRHQSTPVVILARTLTPAAQSFAAQFCKKSFLALERAGTGTRAYFEGHPNGIELADTSLWVLDEFLEATIGTA